MLSANINVDPTKLKFYLTMYSFIFKCAALMEEFFLVIFCLDKPNMIHLKHFCRSLLSVLYSLVYLTTSIFEII